MPTPLRFAACGIAVKPTGEMKRRDSQPFAKGAKGRWNRELVPCGWFERFAMIFNRRPHIVGEVGIDRCGRFRRQQRDALRDGSAWRDAAHGSRRRVACRSRSRPPHPRGPGPAAQRSRWQPPLPRCGSHGQPWEDYSVIGVRKPLSPAAALPPFRKEHAKGWGTRPQPRRSLVPRLGWIETVVGLPVFLFCAVMAVASLHITKASEDRFLHISLQLSLAGWALLGGVMIAARVAQWRIRKSEVARRRLHTC